MHQINPSIYSGENIFDVINTIFPYKHIGNYEALSRKELYNNYISAHKRSRDMGRNKSTWGTYFLRLIELNGQKQEKINQLEEAIIKINTLDRNYSSFVNFHITSRAFEKWRTRGGPCLQYIQIGWDTNRIFSTVVYRNHDYFNKTLGNLIGIFYLLNFIALSTNREVERLSCISIQAFCNDKKNTKRYLEKIIELRDEWRKNGAIW
jgi:thymidylate synthase